MRRIPPTRGAAAIDTKSHFETHREIRVILAWVTPFIARLVTRGIISLRALVGNRHGNGRFGRGQIFIKEAWIDIPCADVIQIVSKEFAVNQLEGYIEVFAKEIFDAHTHGDVELGQLIFFTIGVFRKPLAFGMQGLEIDPDLVALWVAVRALGIKVIDTRAKHAIRSEPARHVIGFVLQEDGRIELGHHGTFQDHRFEVQVTNQAGLFVAAMILDQVIVRFDVAIRKGSAESQPLLGIYCGKRAKRQFGGWKIVVFDKCRAFTDMTAKVSQSYHGAYGEARFGYHSLFVLAVRVEREYGERDDQ